MPQPKKIITIGIKLIIGIISFWVIYKRLAEIPGLKSQLLYWLSDASLYATLLLTIVLMPVNWGIESYKWKITTEQVELISYKTALKSIFSGICAGNLAPGRAIEFLAKIVFFKIENRPKITILHFLNGMFQMLITVTCGTAAILYKLNNSNQPGNLLYIIISGGILLVILFYLAITNVAYIQKKLRFISWFKQMDETEKLHFSKTLIVKLTGLSIIRYAVFTSQFYLIYHALCPETTITNAFTAIAAYFMLTSIIPMISYIEPAIRAAIALFVFNTSADNSVSVVLASTFVWIINVVIPSVIGYIIIFKEKIVFKLPSAN